MEIDVEHEVDSVKITIKEKDNNMEKEIKQKQEKTKLLEVENEILEKITRNHAIEKNKKKRTLKN